MAVDTSPSLRRRLSRLWRQRLTPDTTAQQPAAVTPPPPSSPEEAPVGHIYVSGQPEPGQTTTALGRHHTAEHLTVRPREVGDRTQVIRVPKRAPDPVGTDRHGHECGCEICAQISGALTRRQRDPLGPTTALALSTESEQADPPIYLATVGAVQRLRDLPPAAEGDSQEPDDGCAVEADQPAKEGEDQ